MRGAEGGDFLVRAVGHEAVREADVARAGCRGEAGVGALAHARHHNGGPARDVAVGVVLWGEALGAHVDVALGEVLDEGGRHVVLNQGLPYADEGTVMARLLLGKDGIDVATIGFECTDL